jgi:hypothetical protein
LTTVPQDVIGQHTGHHGFPNRGRTYPDARVMAARRHHRNLFKIAV